MGSSMNGWTNSDSNAWDSMKVTTQSADYSAGISDQVIMMDCRGGTRTVTLPAAALILGKSYTIFKVDPSANPAIVVVDGGGTINGSGSYTLTSENSTVTVINDSSQWYIRCSR